MHDHAGYHVGYVVVGLSGYRVIGLSGYLYAWSLGCQVIRLLGYRGLSPRSRTDQRRRQVDISYTHP